jgi:two-component system, response regulator YesN
LNISVSYLSMLLKKQKGVTFNKELIKYRMEKAKELLRFSQEKIVNIAKMVGYNEVYYFSHSFKKYEGVSPKEFRTNA